jgi:hypothetical protein
LPDSLLRVAKYRFVFVAAQNGFNGDVFSSVDTAYEAFGASEPDTADMVKCSAAFGMNSSRPFSEKRGTPSGWTVKGSFWSVIDPVHFHRQALSDVSGLQQPIALALIAPVSRLCGQGEFAAAESV